MHVLNSLFMTNPEKNDIIGGWGLWDHWDYNQHTGLHEKYLLKNIKYKYIFIITTFPQKRNSGMFWILLTISQHLGNGLSPDGTKPLPEPILTKSTDTLGITKGWL